MITKVRAYIKKHQLLSPGARVTVALSGGADSVCLLLCLCELREEYDLRLRAVHVNHGLRGSEAERDAAFCEALCARLGVPFCLRSQPVAAYAREHRLSLEESGRILRYRALHEEAAGGLIAVAHHRDDQAETLLFRLIRGSGLRGLAGMLPRRGSVIRPLLCVDRAQIEDYLAARGQDYQVDSSNREDVYARNRIRHQLLPLLREWNPKASQHLCRLAEEAAELEAWISEEAGRWLLDHAEGTGRWLLDHAEGSGPIGLPLAELEKLPPVLGKRVLLEALERCAGGGRDIGSRHVEALWELREKPVGSRLNLPRGVAAERSYGEVILRRGREGSSSPVEGPAVPLPSCEFSVFPWEKGKKIPEKQYTKWFDYDKIEHNALWRFREPGDYLVLGGVGRKTVKAYMIDKKIPAAERDQIPVLADGSHVLWILGYRISEAYKVTDQTRQVLQVTLGGRKDEGKDSCIDF